MRKAVSIFVSLVIALAMLISLSACGSSIEEDWKSVTIGENLPTPQKGKLRIGSDLDDGFYGGIEKVDADYYAEYKKACVKMGYTIDSNETSGSYEAFNADGYKLSLDFYDNEISIILIAPENLSEFSWPTTGIGAKLPVPVSLLGKVNSDSSDCFRVTIGNTTIDDYNNYVKSCEQQGFNVDYNKNEKNYEAKDSNGFILNVSYVGCNRISIMIQTSKKESTTTSKNEESSKEGLSKDFKEAMDSYEKFMNEYVSFMKKYKENPSNTSLLSDYATYVSKYANFVKDFEKWENKNLNAVETAYYIDVQARVTKKLLEVAN